MNHRRWLLATIFIAFGLSVIGLPDQETSSTKKGEPAQNGSITIAAGPDWVPLKLDLDMEPGSALDFSRMGFQDAPAGKHGRIIARPDGQFAFEKDPNTARRFYGVNLCFSAHYISHEEAEKLADRLMRLGYNAVRVHHYERELVEGQPNSLTFNPEKLDQMDHLLAAFSKRGIYITTDLFVSRPVRASDIGLKGNGIVEMNRFKVLVPVHEGAWKNWKAFAKAFLEHVNPYTKWRYADDPALAWLSMINEGNFGNFIGDLRNIPEWTGAWNAWLLKRYRNRETLVAAWNAELRESEDPANGSVALPENLTGDGLRIRDAIAFLSSTEREMVERMSKFIRGELGCKALITNSNGWTNYVTMQSSRAMYDYVDDHFYVDHPQFIEKRWRLPSRSPNTSPIAAGAPGGRHTGFTRLFDKPFTITEYNYSGPGRFRGVGGILTGALGALQGWGGMWRFAYSHNRQSLFQPDKMGYFDMVSDPLSQASERATLCLYLRGDMKMAPHSFALVMTQKDLDHPPARIPRLAPLWHWMAWVTRVGTQVTDYPAALNHTRVLELGWAARSSDRAETNAHVNPYAMDNAKLMSLLRESGILSSDNPTDPEKGLFRSETGEITIDAPRGVLIIDTPKTVGGYLPAGETITMASGHVSIQPSMDATVWISSLDSYPIAQSRRLLVTHLTDLQNTEIRYGEAARQTLLDWGRLPHLVRNGKATIRMRIQDAKKYNVWALSTSGKRIGTVRTLVKDNVLEFTADVAERAQQNGARLLYEIARR